MTDLPKIVRIPGVMSGDPVIEGTRVRPETVLLEILDGKPEAEIFETYSTLPVGSVQAVIEWARERLRQHETGGYDKKGLEVLKGMKGNRKEATFTSIDGTEWVMQRVSGETQAEFEERQRLFNDLKKSNRGRIPIASELNDTDTYSEIASMMIATCALDEILAAHPDADIDAVMRWHKERSGDDLATTFAAQEWWERR